MLLRASILALAAIATLATPALVSTPASASWSFGRSIHGGWDVGQNRSHGHQFGSLKKKGGDKE
jgi:hypothetical protein